MEDWPVSPRGTIGWAFRKGKAMIKAAIFGLRGSVVFDDIDGYERARPPEKYLTSDKFETYALWWSGTGIIKPWMEEKGCNIQRLVLPDPRNREFIEHLESTWTDMELGSVNAIFRTTENALGLGIDLYWYWGWPGDALTFQNPTSDKGTLAVEPIAEHRGPNSRPITFYRRKKNEDLYRQEWRRFQKIVDNSTHIKPGGLSTIRGEFTKDDVRQPSADFKKHDSRDEWPIYQIAFLWHGFEPPPVTRHWQQMNSDIEATKDMLHSAVEAGNLTTNRVKQRTGGLTRYISREELTRFCEERAEKPPFLFPNER